MINCMKAWNYQQKILGSRLSTEIIKQTHKIMMEDEEDVQEGEYRKSLAFASCHIFEPAGYIERYMEDAVFRFHGTKKDDPIMAATNLFGNINIHPFEDGNGRICRLILAHVLMQMKCCLFPVILSSFHGRDRRHYIRVVKMFDRKLSMLYTMIVKSLIHCWGNFEQNALVQSIEGFDTRSVLTLYYMPDTKMFKSVGTCLQTNNDLAGAQNCDKDVLFVECF